MLVIRLSRVGRKHQPHYRVVVSERRSKLGGPPVEDFGFYNPSTKKSSINKERVLHWLGMGAKSSPTAHNLFVKEGILIGPKKAIKMRKAAEDKKEAAPESQAATPSVATSEAKN